MKSNLVGKSVKTYGSLTRISSTRRDRHHLQMPSILWEFPGMEHWVQLPSKFNKGVEWWDSLWARRTGTMLAPYLVRLVTWQNTEVLFRLLPAFGFTFPLRTQSFVLFLFVFIFLPCLCRPIKARIFKRYSLYSVLRNTITMDCYMDLRNFPFDVQKCNLNIESCKLESFDYAFE